MRMKMKKMCKYKVKKKKWIEFRIVYTKWKNETFFIVFLDIQNENNLIIENINKARNEGIT